MDGETDFLQADGENQDYVIEGIVFSLNRSRSRDDRGQQR